MIEKSLTTSKTPPPHDKKSKNRIEWGDRGTIFSSPVYKLLHICETTQRVHIKNWDLIPERDLLIIIQDRLRGE